MGLAIWLVLIGLAGYIGWTVWRGAPYVPTHHKQLRRLFTEIVELTEDDTLVDLGAGDGVVLKSATDHGAKAIGYEINWFLVWLMRLRFLRQPNISVIHKDYLKLLKLPESTTVVYAFATSRDIKRIDSKMLEWSRDKPLMLISYGFSIDGKTPLKTLAPFNLYRYE